MKSIRYCSLDKAEEYYQEVLQLDPGGLVAKTAKLDIGGCRLVFGLVQSASK